MYNSPPRTLLDNFSPYYNYSLSQIGVKVKTPVEVQYQSKMACFIQVEKSRVGACESLHAWLQLAIIQNIHTHTCIIIIMHS